MQFIIQIIKGVIRDQSSRRMAMFGIVIAALVLLFAGVTFLSGFLTERPMTFLGYWVVCAWLTFASILLALYDLIATRAASRRESRRLKNEVFDDVQKPGEV